MQSPIPLKSFEIVLSDQIVQIDCYHFAQLSSIDAVVTRCYTIAHDPMGKYVLVYNSKRGIWGFAGGHVETNETIETTAQREFEEETGLQLISAKPSYILVNKLDDTHAEAQIIFVGQTNNQPSKIEKEADESVNAIKAVKKDEIFELLDPSTAKLWQFILDYNS